MEILNVIKILFTLPALAVTVVVLHCGSFECSLFLYCYIYSFVVCFILIHNCGLVGFFIF